jgi:hypothetical protein
MTRDHGSNSPLSKHMDKHDRPYKCTARGCEKLLGFTYSGGLLRHEREVHKMHGGTKKSLYCPHQDCKRSSGTGFTRRENLHEHIRRVHRSSADLGNLAVRIQDPQDHSQPFACRETQEEDILSPSSKRKRENDFSTEPSEVDPVAEIKRLRQENARLEAENQQLRRKLR